MLNRLYVDNYRSLVNFELLVPRIGLLLGANGSGKTSVGEVLRGLSFCVAGGVEVQAQFPAASLTRWVKSTRQSFKLDISRGGAEGKFRYSLELSHDTARQQVTIADEQLEHDGATLYRFSDGTVKLYGDDPSPAPRTHFAFDRKRSFLSSLEPRDDNTKIIAFRDMVRSFTPLKPDPPRIAERSEEEQPGILYDGSNLASWYRHLVQTQPEVQEALTSSLRDVMPGFQHLRFDVFGSSVRELKALFRVDGQLVPFGLQELSDGQRMLILLYALLHTTARDELIILDEPDNFLALREIRPWLTLFEDRLVDVGAQALIISHSTETIDHLASRDVWVLSRPEGGATRVDPLARLLDQGVRASEWLAMGGADDTVPSPGN